jgi:spore coat polysaccharide biosynthesis predicted glycosyltransferase SpsG
VGVIDRPDPDAAAEAYPSSRRVVFDDVGVFSGEAAIVVQPSGDRWLGPGHAGRVLAGYRWVPIGMAWRRRIARVDEASHVQRDAHPRVVVCFGGSDPDGVTARLAPILAVDRRWSATIVVGHGYRGERPPGTDIRTDPDDLPALVAGADLALISAGTIKFEVAALGRPALLVGVADDQRDVGPAFAETGAARWIGDGRTLEPEVVRDAVAACLMDAADRAAMSAAGPSVIDGRGADRLAAEIAALTRPT